ncbi:MAG TPA: hypothetical protein VJS37_08265, partial [Terriglobales bacterium]|nr:hypothetical protein [Terriglobales bacterium]
NSVDVAAPKVSLLVAKDSLAAYLMPSFIGRPLGSVTLAIKDAGFSLGKVTVSQATVADDSTPAAAGEDSRAQGQNAVVSEGSSSPPTNSPKAATSPQTVAPSPASIVVAQQPVAGQKIVAGAEIRLVVR